MHALMFILAIGGSLLVSIFYSPVFAFIAYQSVYFINIENRWWRYMLPSLSYSMIAVVVMMLVLLFNRSNLPTNNIKDVAPLKWMFALGAIFIFVSYFAVLPEYHSPYRDDFLKLIITCALAFKLITDEKKIDYVLYAYIFGCWYIGLVALQTGRNFGDRLEGIGPIDAKMSNGTGSVLAPCLVLCLHYFYFAKSKIQKGLIAFAGALTANGLVLVNSRGAFLAATCSLAYYVFMLYRNPLKSIAQRSKVTQVIKQTKYRKLKVIILIFFGLASVVYVADDSFIERIQTIVVQKDTKKESGSTRMYFWKAAWEMTKDYPMGVGIRGFEYLAPNYIPVDVDTGRSRNRSVHSSYFEVLSEAGYLGLAAFILMLYSSYKLTKITRRVLKEKLMEKQYFQIVAIEAMLLSLLVSSIFINRSRAVVLYWFVAFLCSAYCVYVKRQDMNESISIEKRPIQQGLKG